jgi:hypothetical protein
MDRTEKLSLIARFESSIDPLVDFVKELPAAAVDFRPNLPGAWSIRDHAVHFWTPTRSPTAACAWRSPSRARRSSCGTRRPGKKGPSTKRRTRLPAGTARALRHVVCAMARALVDADWEDFYVRHSQRGRMNLADVFKLYTDHAQFHLSYFRRNLDAFKAAAASVRRQKRTAGPLPLASGAHPWVITH